MELHGREMADEFCHVTFRDLLHAVNLRHGTDGFTSPPKEGVLKNPTASVGFEPANLGTKGQHATSRPPKVRLYVLLQNTFCQLFHLATFSKSLSVSELIRGNKLVRYGPT